MFSELEIFLARSLLKIINHWVKHWVIKISSIICIYIIQINFELYSACLLIETFKEFLAVYYLKETLVKKIKHMQFAVAYTKTNRLVYWVPRYGIFREKKLDFWF